MYLKFFHTHFLFLKVDGIIQNCFQYYFFLTLPSVFDIFHLERSSKYDYIIYIYVRYGDCITTTITAVDRKQHLGQGQAQVELLKNDQIFWRVYFYFYRVFKDSICLCMSSSIIVVYY